MDRNLSQMLRVFEIERFSLHDGPGIRTTVFLRGCPLKCPWCANPESWDCGRAQKQAMTPEGPAIYGLKQAEASSSKVQSVEDILAIVLRDMDYYAHTGGGLTVSGGEPFMQAAGLKALLQAAKQKGLHTVIETCGQALHSDFESVLAYVDLFLFDLKHADGKVLKDITDGDLDLILKNLALAVQHSKVIARIPVIPGFNYAEAALSAILQLAASYGVTEANLLPYHTLGKGKYAKLGIPYTWEYSSLTKHDISTMLQKIDTFGITVG